MFLLTPLIALALLFEARLSGHSKYAVAPMMYAHGMETDYLDDPSTSSESLTAERRCREMYSVKGGMLFIGRPSVHG